MLQYLRMFNFIQKLSFVFSKEAGTKYVVFPKMVILLKPWAGDTGDIAGLRCRNLTSDVSRQCRGCAGVLISQPIKSD